MISRPPGVTSKSSSTRTHVSRLAATASQAPRATSRRRSGAPALARNVISAATIRIASNPSRTSRKNEATNRFIADGRSATTRSARSRPASNRSRIVLRSAASAFTTRVRSQAKFPSSSLASPALLARIDVSTCSNVMYASTAILSDRFASAESIWCRTAANTAAVADPPYCIAAAYDATAQRSLAGRSSANSGIAVPGVPTAIRR